MKTVGTILRQARESKKISLVDVEKATKIRSKFLEAIERDEYQSLPTIAYAKGFVKNYAEFLGLRSDTILAFFRRQTEEAPRSSIVLRGLANPLNTSIFRLTPSRFLTLLLISVIGLFAIYLGLQYKKLQQVPSLSINSPQPHQVVHERRVEVLGKTDTDATMTINGISVLVRGDGKFFDQVSLNPGINHIVVVATSRFGKIHSATRDVLYQQ